MIMTQKTALVFTIMRMAKKKEKNFISMTMPSEHGNTMIIPANKYALKNIMEISNMNKNIFCCVFATLFCFLFPGKNFAQDKTEADKIKAAHPGVNAVIILKKE